MLRLIFAITVPVLAATLGACAASQPAAPPRDAPNIIMFLVDDLDHPHRRAALDLQAERPASSPPAGDPPARPRVVRKLPAKLRSLSKHP